MAEAVLLARANPQLAVVIDNFVELDRGYCTCAGLLDRLYNPKDGSRVVANLGALLPQTLRDLTSQEITGSRVFSAEGDGGKVMLVVPNSRTESAEFNDLFAAEIADRQGTLVDLVSGEEKVTTLQQTIAQRAGQDTPQSPVLLMFNL